LLSALAARVTASAGFGQVNLITDAASSTYNSLQVSFTRSMSHGLMMQASYTWSKSIDNSSSSLPTQDYLGDGILQNANRLSDSRALSNYDMPHRLLVTGIWAVPFAGSLTGKFSTALLKGWQFETATVAQSGVPVNVFSGPVLGISDVNLDGNTTGGAALDNTLALFDWRGRHHAAERLLQQVHVLATVAWQSGKLSSQCGTPTGIVQHELVGDEELSLEGEWAARLWAMASATACPVLQRAQ
jgi:hypothetical protein